jgi:hypothetical protein
MNQKSPIVKSHLEIVKMRMPSTKINSCTRITEIPIHAPKKTPRLPPEIENDDSGDLKDL